MKSTFQYSGTINTTSRKRYAELWNRRDSHESMQSPYNPTNFCNITILNLHNWFLRVRTYFSISYVEGGSRGLHELTSGPYIGSINPIYTVHQTKGHSIKKMGDGIA